MYVNMQPNDVNMRDIYIDMQLKVALGVCFALKSRKEYLLLFAYLTTLGKYVTFPLITKVSELFICIWNTRIKMQPRRLIHDINKPVLNLYFRFEFFIRKLNNYLCTSLIIRLARILMIDNTKMWLDIRYKTNFIM